MKRRTWYSIFALAAFIGAVMVATLFFKPLGNNLLSRAKPVADTSHWLWKGEPGDTQGDTYFWLSNHEILHPDDASNRLPTFYRFDTRSKRDTLVPALSSLVLPISLAALSPDKTTLVYAVDAVPPSRFAAARVGGPQPTQHKQRIVNFDPMQSVWMPDSKHLMEVVSGDGRVLDIRTLEGPRFSPSPFRPAYAITSMVLRRKAMRFWGATSTSEISIWRPKERRSSRTWIPMPRLRASSLLRIPCRSLGKT